MFDYTDEMRLGFIYLADILGHGGRNAITNKNDDHRCECDYDPITSIVLWAKNPSNGTVDNIAGDVENHLGYGKP